MARTKSSRQWLSRHFADPLVQRAQREGYRSRSAYKLLELDARDRLLRPGLTVCDLGAAPGGWSQVVVERLQGTGKVIATDLLPLPPLAGVTFIQGDFRESTVLEQLLSATGGEVGLVISDMAPNMSGIASIDQARAMALVELATEFAQQVLIRRGDFLVKVFEGEGIEAWLRNLRLLFDRVLIRKPKASRSESREIYVVARGYKGEEPRIMEKNG